MSLRRRINGEYIEKEIQHANETSMASTAASSLGKHRFLMKTVFGFFLITIAILSFGTVYSDITSRDACQVLKNFRVEDVPEDLPRLFHFQSKSFELTEQTQTWIEVMAISSATQEYPHIKSEGSTWKAVYWSDDSCRKLVEDVFPYFISAYNSFPHNIQKVDACRYLILSVYGGVYADTDISIHASNASEFEHFIPEGVGLVESPFRYNEVWQNSLMTASSTGHAFWNVTIEIMMERQGDEVVLSSTGPKMIGDAVHRFRGRYGDGNYGRRNVHTLPCELFQRLPSGDWDTTFLNIIGREVLARVIPMRGCGQYGNGICEICRHTGRASWTGDAGLT